jgi:rhodanese-related sulfurtransferase
MEASDSEEPLPFERTPAEIAELIEGGAQLIDVRQDYEYEAARIPGAHRIGLEILADDRDAVKKDEPVVFYCRTGTRSAMAAIAFSDAGYDASSLTGGITAWVEDGREIDPADGYIAEPGEAAAILEARARASSK